MRNLKKILALVLALLMSLSLMATASATTFSDDDSINDTYRQAVEVLNGLEVLKGDDNGFRPEGDITRAEVAAIIYRITTGDVTDARVDNFTPYGQFSDVNDGSWYAGYVTYSANAGYIKGGGNGKFNPNNNVTGYEVLTMILRTVGYDKAPNEFTGPDWQLHVASRAQELGILDNCQSVRLGDDAKRQEVAEMIFRAILLNKVDYSTATLSYTPNNGRVADVLGLERVEGVVVANQWADLRDDDVTDVDKTVLDTGKSEVTLDVATTLDDIGESRYAYIKDSTVLGSLEDTGNNQTWDNEGEPVATQNAMASKSELSGIADAEHFLNFGDTDRDSKSEWRIEYAVNFKDADAQEEFEERLGFELDDEVASAENIARDRIARLSTNDTDYFVDADTNGMGKTYTRVIPAGDEITVNDKAIMKTIFNLAGSFNAKQDTFATLTSTDIAGHVYTGTRAGSTTVDNENDHSDDMLYADFEDKYIYSSGATNILKADRGEWLKIVSNDGDSVADYVFLVTYELDEIINYNTRTEAYTFQAAHAGDEGRTKIIDSNRTVYLDPITMGDYELDGTNSVGDKVITTEIDGQCLIWEAQTVTETIKKYNYERASVEATVDTESGESYYESGIENDTLYAEEISLLQPNREYYLYLDLYGNIRAYIETSKTSNYALLTDMWTERSQNSNFVTSRTAHTEMTYAQDGVKVPTDEYTVSNYGYAQAGAWITTNPFIGIEQTARFGDGVETDVLQRAMAHLGLSRYAKATDTDETPWSTATYGGSNGTYGTVITDGTTVLGDEFDYDGVLWTASNTKWNSTDTTNKGSIAFSGTNIARYELGEDGKSVSLTTAAEYAYNKRGEQLYYVVVSGVRTGETITEEAWKDAQTATVKAANPTWTDKQIGDKVEADWYAALSLNPVNGLEPMFAVDYVMLDATEDVKAAQTQYKIDVNHRSRNNGYVNAVSDTEFWIVSPNGITYKLGREEIPAIDADLINAIYAVAENTDRDGTAGTRNYWVADVIVIELIDDLPGSYGRRFLNLWDSYRDNNSQRAIVHELNGFDCETGAFTTVLLTDSTWAGAVSAGFYLLSDDAIVNEDGSLEAKTCQYMTEYNPNNVYAGDIVRVESNYSRGLYIDVAKRGADDPATPTSLIIPADTPWYAITQNSRGQVNGYEEMIASEYNNKSANRDRIVWVEDSRGNVIFVVDTTCNSMINYITPARFMQTEANAIILEQRGDHKWDISSVVRDSSGAEIRNVDVKVYNGSTNKIISSILRNDAESSGYELELKVVVEGVSAITSINATNAHIVGTPVTSGNTATLKLDNVNGDVKLNIVATPVTKTLDVSVLNFSAGSGWASATDYSAFDATSDVTINGQAWDGTSAVVVGSDVVVTVYANKEPVANLTYGSTTQVLTATDGGTAAGKVTGAHIYTFSFTMPNGNTKVEIGPKQSVTVTTTQPSKYTATALSYITKGGYIDGIKIELGAIGDGTMNADQHFTVKDVIVDGTSRGADRQILAYTDSKTITLQGNTKVNSSIVIELEPEYNTRTVTITVGDSGCSGSANLTEPSNAAIATVVAKVDNKEVSGVFTDNDDSTYSIDYNIPMDKDIVFTITRGPVEDANKPELSATLTASGHTLDSKLLTMSESNGVYTLTIYSDYRDTSTGDVSVAIEEAAGEVNTGSTVLYTVQGLGVGDNLTINYNGNYSAQGLTFSANASENVLQVPVGAVIASVEVELADGNVVAADHYFKLVGNNDLTTALEVVDLTGSVKSLTFTPASTVAVSTATTLTFSKSHATKTYTLKTAGASDLASTDSVVFSYKGDIGTGTVSIDSCAGATTQGTVAIPENVSVTQIVVDKAAGETGSNNGPEIQIATDMAAAVTGSVNGNVITFTIDNVKVANDRDVTYTVSN